MSQQDKQTLIVIGIEEKRMLDRELLHKEKVEKVNCMLDILIAQNLSFELSKYIEDK